MGHQAGDALGRCSRREGGHEPRESPRGSQKGVILWKDEIHFAPPRKPEKNDFPVKTSEHWFLRVVQDFVHPQ